jgi:hypothetical protein
MLLKIGQASWPKLETVTCLLETTGEQGNRNERYRCDYRIKKLEKVIWKMWVPEEPQTFDKAS